MILERKQIIECKYNDTYSIEIEEVNNKDIILACYSYNKITHHKTLLAVITQETIEKNNLQHDWGLTYDIYKVAEYCNTLYLNSL